MNKLYYFISLNSVNVFDKSIMFINKFKCIQRKSDNTAFLLEAL